MPTKPPDAKTVAEDLTTHLAAAVGLGTTYPAREDSRAFGAMLEKRILDAWPSICVAMNATALARPGRRTIYDFAMRHGGVLVGLEVKTKALDSRTYSDGGVCSVGNLIQFLVRDQACLMVAEIAHKSDGNDGRIVAATNVAPIHLLPVSDLRLENLGKGQVRLNRPIHALWPDIVWDRTLPQFLDIFTDLAVAHYGRVGEVAAQRADAMRAFRAGGFSRLELP